MKTFYKLLILSILGLALALSYIIYDHQTASVQIQPILNVQAPYQSFIYATGIVESDSTNIPIGSAISGIVSELFVQAGQKINVGDALFSIDSRDTQAKIQLGEEKIKVADTTLTKILHQYQIDKKLYEQFPGSISKKKYLLSVDEFALAKANQSLAKVELMVLTKELERHTVYSPITGHVLQSDLRVGEYIDSGAVAPRSIIVGSNKLNLRVDINENDLLRFKEASQVTAFIHNQPTLQIPLHYQYVVPYVVPKTALTGLSTERTDLRVLQVIYDVDIPDFPLYVGQQLDVFIEAPVKVSL